MLDVLDDLDEIDAVKGVAFEWKILVQVDAADALDGIAEKWRRAKLRRHRPESVGAQHFGSVSPAAAQVQHAAVRLRLAAPELRNGFENCRIGHSGRDSKSHRLRAIEPAAFLEDSGNPAELSLLVESGALEIAAKEKQPLRAP